MSNTYIAVSIVIMATVTMLLRSLPFLVFSGKEPPLYIRYLGKYLPCAIMGMLVVYCLKSISFVRFPFGLPEVISMVLVVLLHIWKRNTLVSIIAGTVCYMLLTQFIL